MELAGKIVIVTGAAGNLGSACAREIARQGAKLVAADLAGTGVTALVDGIAKSGGEAVAHQGDISAETDVVAMIEVAKQRFGGLDVLVNVAAAMDLVMRDRDITAMEVDDWDRMMAVNLRGAMLCCKHAIPAMRARGAGSIIHFGSTAAILGDDGLFAYSTTKSALLGFTRAIATAYGKEGIRCNAVCPGSVWSEDTKAQMGAEMLEFMERTRLTPRLGVPQDIAHMVVFLASDKASYITGQTFVVDGGGTVHQPWVRVR
jgi:NAD(P)-dependent dehydrogenase (short-subunit alcohol dehydrogenase family)